MLISIEPSEAEDGYWALVYRACC